MPANGRAARMKSAGPTIDAYLKKVEEPARSTLQTLRRQIHAAAPGATEHISYGMPAFKLDGHHLVAFASFKAHCSFFPMNATLVQELAPLLKKYGTSKGTIRFPVDQPLPAALVKKIVKARAKQNAEKYGA